jgi:hypothetical protein
LLLKGLNGQSEEENTFRTPRFWNYYGATNFNDGHLKTSVTQCHGERNVRNDIHVLGLIADSTLSIQFEL